MNWDTNIERHIAKRKQNALAGGILGAIVGGAISAYTGRYSAVGQNWDQLVHRGKKG